MPLELSVALAHLLLIVGAIAIIVLPTYRMLRH